jgi:S1-C subfamily serine protease
MFRLCPAAWLIALVLAVSACAAKDYPDDRFVADVHALRPSIVLLTMKVPPEHKSDGYDDAYATGTVIASGSWGSDILTVQHAVDGAWDMHAMIGNKTKVPAKVIAENADMDVALVRTKKAPLPVVKLGTSQHLDDAIGREIGLLGYPIPDEFDDEGLGLGTSLNVGRLSSIRKGALEVTLQIVPGESGAPIFVADTGSVIGIAESRFDSERSIGFALPIDDAKKFLHKVDAAHGF